MDQIEFNDGEIILSENASSDFVYRILSGEVEVFSGQPGESIVLGIANAGEFLGEMGIIERRNRSASARARGHVVTEKMERWEFIQLISDSPMSAHRLIERLSERLRMANQRLSKLAAGNTASNAYASGELPADRSPGFSVNLFSATETLSTNVPPAGIKITDFPFTVGREPRGDEPLPEISVDLQIPDTQPYRLSTAHFSLLRSDSGCSVRDLGSARGTSVNGVFIGDLFERDTCDLKAGKNTVIAGGMYSLYGFNIVVDDE